MCGPWSSWCFSQPRDIELISLKMAMCIIQFHIVCISLIFFFKCCCNLFFVKIDDTPFLHKDYLKVILVVLQECGSIPA